MSGKCRPSLRPKTLNNVDRSNLSKTDKECIHAVFELADRQKAEIEALIEKLNATIAGQETLQKALAEKDEKNKILQERNVILRGAVDTQKAENKRLAGYLADAISHEPKNEAEIKAEAIKEFAERLKERFFYKKDAYVYRGIERRIDNLVKEMAGDAE